MEISDDLLRFVLYGRLRSPFERNFHLQDSSWVRSPPQVCVQATTIPGSKHGVFCCHPIKEGTQMGPFLGGLSLEMVHSSDNCWELFNLHGEIVGYVDGGVHPLTSWLSYIQCARTDREQNLEVVQSGRNIYYRAIKDIEPGEELLVWYGSAHKLYMGLPYPMSRETFKTTETKHEESVEKDNSQKQQQRPRSPTSEGKLRCILCGRGFNSRSNLRSHMRIHTLEKPFLCKFCGRRFSQSSTLRNHVRLHTGEKPYRCLVCKSSYSQLAGLRAHQRSSTHNTQKEPHGAEMKTLSRETGT